MAFTPRKYKKIISNHYYYNQSITITNNLININNIIEKIDKYKNNRKRETFPVKKLSIWN